MFAPAWQRATSEPFSASAAEPPEPAPGDVLEEYALDRIARAEVEDLRQVRLHEAHRLMVDRQV